MRKITISLFPVIVVICFFLSEGVCIADIIPLGVNNPYDESAPKEKAYLIKPYMNDLGVRWVNDNVFRKRVEPRPGVYDWREPDFLVKDIFKDLDLVFNINPKTSWQTKGSIKVDKNSYIPGGDIDSESYKLYRTFLKELIKRYKDRVHRWEVFNEPGLEYKDIPEDYVRLLKISYITIKEIDPKAIVCLGGQMATPHS